MLDQFVRVVFPMVRLPRRGTSERPVVQTSKTSLSLFVQRRAMSCFLQRVESPVLWDYHDLLGDCLSMPLSWCL